MIILKLIGWSLLLILLLMSLISFYVILGVILLPSKPIKIFGKRINPVVVFCLWPLFVTIGFILDFPGFIKDTFKLVKEVSYKEDEEEEVENE